MTFLTKQGRWLVGMLFYPRAISDFVIDAKGERIIAELLPELAELVATMVGKTYFTWLRYSVGGFHIRFQIWLPNTYEVSELKAAVLARVDAFKLLNPDIFQGQMHLTPIADRLNQIANNYVLKEAGQLILGLADQTNEERVYIAFADFDMVQSIISLDSAHVLAAIKRVQSVAKRWGAALLLMSNSLMHLTPQPVEAATLCLFIRNTWLNMFKITPTDYAADKAYLQKLGITLIDAVSRNDIREKLMHGLMLHAELSAWLNTRNQLLDPKRLAYDDQNLFVMQLLSLIHHTFNRFGVSILQEIASAEFFYEYYIAQVSEFEKPAIEAECEWLIAYWENINVIEH